LTKNFDSFGLSALTDQMSLFLDGG